VLPALTHGRGDETAHTNAVSSEDRYDDTEDVWDDTPEGDRRPPRGPRTQPAFRNSTEYRALRGQFLYRCRTKRNKDGSYGLPCWLCSKPINYLLHYLSPWAATVDHVIPVRLAPERALDVTNWAPAHSHCNVARQRKLDDELANLGTPSRAW
jgi:5-methylcytosine-specific restriction endonuclease McrA